MNWYLRFKDGDEDWLEFGDYTYRTCNYCQGAWPATCLWRIPVPACRARLDAIRLPTASEGVSAMTVQQKFACRVAGIFFAAWLLLALAIADFPPPPGFVILVMILLACALLVFLRIPVYLRWRPTPLAHG